MAEVMDHVRLDKVRSLLRMIHHRRRFVRRHELRMQAQGELFPAPTHVRPNRPLLPGVPDIIVEGAPTTPQLGSRDITQAEFSGELTPSPRASQFLGQDSTFPSPPSSPRSPRSRRRVSDLSRLSGDDTYRYS